MPYLLQKGIKIGDDLKRVSIGNVKLVPLAEKSWY